MNSRVYDLRVHAYSKAKCPCQNCKENNEMCHVVCDRYAEYQRMLNIIKEENRKAYQAEIVLEDFKISNSYKAKKQKKREI